MGRILLVLFIAAILPAVAAAYWPVFHGNSQANGFTKEPGIQKPVIKWEFEGDGIYMLHSPVVGDDGTIYALKGTGDYMTGNDTLYAITPDGALKWRYTREELRFTQPSVFDGTVYSVATKGREGSETRMDSYLLAIDAANGKERWERHLTDLRVETWISRIVIDRKGRVYASAGDVLAVFTPKGEKLWSYKVASIPVAWTGGDITGPTLSPDEETVYFLKRTGVGILALEAETGKMKWSDNMAYSNHWAPPVVGPDGIIYASDANTKALYAINPDGRVKWKSAFVNEYEYLGGSIAAIGADGTVYITTEKKQVTSVSGSIYALNSQDGTVKWSYRSKRGVLISPPAVDKGGRIYFGTGDGYIHCLNSDGSLLWKALVGYEVKEGQEYSDGDHMTQIYMSGPVLSNGDLYIITGRISKWGKLVSIGEK